MLSDKNLILIFQSNRSHIQVQLQEMLTLMEINDDRVMLLQFFFQDRSTLNASCACQCRCTAKLHYNDTFPTLQINSYYSGWSCHDRRPATWFSDHCFCIIWLWLWACWRLCGANTDAGNARTNHFHLSLLKILAVVKSKWAMITLISTTYCESVVVVAWMIIY